jgi:hypothetical protein
LPIAPVTGNVPKPEQQCMVNLLSLFRKFKWQGGPCLWDQGGHAPPPPPHSYFVGQGAQVADTNRQLAANPVGLCRAQHGCW